MHPKDVEAAAAVMSSGWITAGPKVEEFEQAIARLVGKKHGVMVNSCTNGHMLVFRYIAKFFGGNGLRAVFPAVTFAGPISQAVHAGFDVLLSDVEKESGAATSNHFKTALGGSDMHGVVTPYSGTTVLCPMHYRGVATVEMGSYMDGLAGRNDYLVVEDAAHALGSKYPDGNLVGHDPDTLATIFSFYPTKTLNALEGGMILTSSDHLANWCRQARLHGVSKSVHGRYQGKNTAWGYDLAQIGYKCNPTDVQAAFGLSQLTRYPETLRKLKKIALRYDEVINAKKSGGYIHVSDGQMTGNQHLFVVWSYHRDRLFNYLLDKGIQCSVHYPPLWEMTGWQHQLLQYAQDSRLLKGAKWFSSLCLSLPIYASMTKKEVDTVCAALESH